ncbi:hypothetical protein [Massilia sp. Root335]|uniref:hypothetical protein n=1 Tax=Massilia sp. Root335 TaxID=1736517 RepID=UPI0012F648E7|nr:hypothetical protein [Massilia sp. Root335]
MKGELDSPLYKRYPKIFADRQRTMCREGWFDLIDVLCDRLQTWTNLNGAPQVVVSEVKEKWGELSFNIKGGSREQEGMIIMAEEMSARICELCGNAGRLLVAGETYLTRCHLHAPPGATTAPMF